MAEAENRIWMHRPGRWCAWVSCSALPRRCMASFYHGLLLMEM